LLKIALRCTVGFVCLLDLGGLLLLEIALTLLGLGDLPAVVFEDAAVALCTIVDDGLLAC
jgi:hypothetical protein